MNKIFIVLLILVLVIGINGYINLTGLVQKTQTIMDDISELKTQFNTLEEEADYDPCSGVVCDDSTKTCPDGYTVRCSNTCIGGACTSCIPSCSGHAVADPCEGVECHDQELECEDGFVASCTRTCDPDTGTCSDCEPDCSGHGCQASWKCKDWGPCEEGLQKRDCWDKNDCGTTEGRPDETRICDEVVLIHHVYYDATDDENNEEWVELYNPGGEEINLSGWSIRDNTRTITFPDDAFIFDESYFIISNNEERFEELYGCTPDMIWSAMRLSNTGDWLFLNNSESENADFVAWENGDNEEPYPYPEWSIESNEGESIMRKQKEQDTDSPDDWEVNEDPEPNC